MKPDAEAYAFESLEKFQFNQILDQFNWKNHQTKKTADSPFVLFKKYKLSQHWQKIKRLAR